MRRLDILFRIIKVRPRSCRSYLWLRPWTVYALPSWTESKKARFLILQHWNTNSPFYVAVCFSFWLVFTQKNRGEFCYDLKVDFVYWFWVTKKVFQSQRPSKIFLFDMGCQEVQWMKYMERMARPGKSVQSSIYKQTKKFGFNEREKFSGAVGSNFSFIKILEAWSYPTSPLGKVFFVSEKQVDPKKKICLNFLQDFFAHLILCYFQKTDDLIREPNKKGMYTRMSTINVSSLEFKFDDTRLSS